MTDDKTDSVLSHVVLSSLPPEPAATLALEFILRNAEARQAFVSLFDLPSMFTESTRVVSEVMLEEDARPDLVIYDRKNKPRLIVENKFWAGLTEAQPVKYLNTLPDDEIDSLLVFVVPKTRSPIIWRELLQRCEDAGFDLPHSENSYSDVAMGRLTDSNRHIGVTNWDTVLVTLINVPNVQEDVRQLRALTDRMDAEAFLPIRPEEVTSVDFVRRLINYADLIDLIVEELKTRNVADTRGLRTGNNFYRSGRYLYLDGQVIIWFGVDLDLWQEAGSTPFWWVIDKTEANSEVWDELEGLFDDMLTHDSHKSLPIYLKSGVDREEVVEDAADQMQEISDRMFGSPIE